MLGLVLVGMLVLIGCQVECPDCICPEYEECEICEVCEECEECPEEKALLVTELSYMAENLYNENELLFDYYVYNYGYKEARNVKVKCMVSNGDKSKKSIIENVGNIASTSTTFKETVLKFPQSERDDDDMGICYVISCDNCEILYKRIPTLRERFK